MKRLHKINSNLQMLKHGAAIGIGPFRSNMNQSKGSKMSYYNTCPNCGSNNDPGEVCLCQKEKRSSAATDEASINELNFGIDNTTINTEKQDKISEVISSLFEEIHSWKPTSQALVGQWLFHVLQEQKSNRELNSLIWMKEIWKSEVGTDLPSHMCNEHAYRGFTNKVREAKQGGVSND